MSGKIIYIVSGLPRSGTSMMMQMLKAGGMDICTDCIRKADEHNPWGYYEYDPVKRIYHDNTWLKDITGAVKIISHLLYYLPNLFNYKIIFMMRDIDDVVKSQNNMLGKKVKMSGKLADCFCEHIESMRVYLANQNNIDVLYVDYELAASKSLDLCNKIKDFFKADLNVKGMLSAINKP